MQAQQKQFNIQQKTAWIEPNNLRDAWLHCNKIFLINVTKNQLQASTTHKKYQKK